MKQGVKHTSYLSGARALKLGSAITVALALSACSTLSMSDFGLGGSESKKTTASTQQQKTTSQAPTVTTAKKDEPGMWDRVTGWFSSDDKPAVKGDNLAHAQSAQSQAAQTTQATQDSLRAAQDISKIQQPVQTPQTSAPQTLAQQVTTAKTPAPQTPNTPLKIASTQVNVPSTTPQNLTQQAPQTLATQNKSLNTNVASQISSAQQQAENQAQPIKAPAVPAKKEESFWGKIGNIFSSDKSKKVAQATQPKKPQSSVNSFTRQATNAQSSETEDTTEDLTPVQTLRLARQSTKGAQASGQGLTPFVPNTKSTTPDAATQIADARLKTNTVTPKTPPTPTIVKSAPKVSTPKVAVKPIGTKNPAPAGSQPLTTASTSANTSYVVTPETYRARQAPSATSVSQTPQGAAKATQSNLATAAPSQNAFKFFFNPGSSDLAPHHIAQLRGLAGQAIARQRQITILGTSNPGGEAGKGNSAAGLQNIAIARAMAAARSLQKFGVPSHMINMRIAQSTTPTEIGTGGNKTLQTMTARRVEVSIQ